MFLCRLGPYNAFQPRSHYKIHYHFVYLLRRVDRAIFSCTIGKGSLMSIVLLGTNGQDWCWCVSTLLCILLSYFMRNRFLCRLEMGESSAWGYTGRITRGRISFLGRLMLFQSHWWCLGLSSTCSRHRHPHLIF